MKEYLSVRSASILPVWCVFVYLLLGGCDYIAVKSAPQKEAVTVRSQEAIAADSQFWQVFNGGHYDRIQSTLELLTSTWLKTPGDAVTASHIAWLHIWRLSERARMEEVPSTIINDAVLARKYFQEASLLNPSDARLQGFLAAAILAESTLDQNERHIRQGYYLLRDAIDAWPEFNLFTAGYVMSTQPVDSRQFREALEWQWETLDACSGTKISRTDPEYAQYMMMKTAVGPKKVCWNSQIVPHNFEGFFLNMGDMLVKSGNWQTAEKIYNLAKLSPDYGTWKFNSVLEERIRNVKSNGVLFADNKGLMVTSAYACMACHQK